MEVQTQARGLQERADAFISENARAEFEKLQGTIKSAIKEANPTLTDLPQYQIHANGMIQQGSFVAFLHFDKPILNRGDNRLMITLGPHPNSMWGFSEPPEPRRLNLYAGCNDAINQIVWLGDLGELTTSQLADVILEGLARYWIENKPA